MVPSGWTKSPVTVLSTSFRIVIVMTSERMIVPIGRTWESSVIVSVYL